MVKVDTFATYTMLLNNYIKFRNEVEPDECMGPLLDALANIDGVVPIFHCSGHGSARLTILLGLRPDVSHIVNNPLLRLYERLNVVSDFEYVYMINSELAQVGKRRRSIGIKENIWSTWSLRINTRRAQGSPDKSVPLDPTTAGAIKELTEQVIKYRLSSSVPYNDYLTEYERLRHHLI